jgi:hypothetical protein
MDEDSYDETGMQALVSPLKVLILNTTHVDDKAALGISTLTNLEELYLEQAKITVEGMTTIMRGCPHLRVVNLKGCRGIPVTQRRQWFELYEAGKVGDVEESDSDDDVPLMTRSRRRA